MAISDLDPSSLTPALKAEPMDKFFTVEGILFFAEENSRVEATWLKESRYKREEEEEDKDKACECELVLHIQVNKEIKKEIRRKINSRTVFRSCGGDSTSASLRTRLLFAYSIFKIIL